MTPAPQSSPRPFRFSNLGIAASVILHLGAFAALNRIPPSVAPAVLSSVVEFEVPPPEPTQPEPESPPEPELKPEPLPLKPAALNSLPEPKSDPAPSDPPEAPVPSPVPVADLTGLTLTNDNGSGSWGSRVGNGLAIERPIRAGANTRKSAPPTPPALSAAPKPSGPPVVAVGDLSSRPVPPRLDGILEQHYPDAARKQGKSGTAVVRLRIDPDGRVRRANIVSESETDFGRACHATVVGSQWSPPRDREGRPVATFVSYTCRFRSTR